MPYYEILGVPPDADVETIKKAYREKAKKYHPDLNPSDKNASKKFNKINHIYRILSDPKLRQMYDVKLSGSGKKTVSGDEPRTGERTRTTDARVPEPRNPWAGSETGENAYGDRPDARFRRFKNVTTSTVIRLLSGPTVAAAVCIFMLLYNYISTFNRTEHKSNRNVNYNKAFGGKEPKIPNRQPIPPGRAPIPPEKEPPPLQEELTRFDHPVAGTLVLIPSGDFSMGSPDTDPAAAPSERPEHKVRIARSFYMASREVTIAQFRQFVGATGYRTDAERDGVGGWGYDQSSRQFARAGLRYSWRETGFTQTSQHPVVNVSWYDAIAFCRWLTTEDRARVFRLPTEAEWEFACRAGTTTVYAHGDAPSCLGNTENVGDLSLVPMLARGRAAELEILNQAAPWFDGHPWSAEVGSFRPNRFGLFDMHGNVSEWVENWYNQAQYAMRDDKTPEIAGKQKVFRGGSWAFGPANCRSARRHYFAPSDRWCNLGFRVVCQVEERPPIAR